MPIAMQSAACRSALLLDAVEYAAKARELGLDVELWLTADQPHGFFNDGSWLEVTALRQGR